MQSYSNSDFPNAPHGWTMETAMEIAADNDVELSDDHWQTIAGLQEYFSKNAFGKRRQLADALEEKFHHKGGLKFLYQLFPGGPVAQGCVIAGMQPPAGSVDKSFGSVV